MSLRRVVRGSRVYTYKELVLSFRGYHASLDTKSSEDYVASFEKTFAKHPQSKIPKAILDKASVEVAIVAATIDKLVSTGYSNAEYGDAHHCAVVAATLNSGVRDDHYYSVLIREAEKIVAVRRIKRVAEAKADYNQKSSVCSSSFIHNQVRDIANFENAIDQRGYPVFDDDEKVKLRLYAQAVSDNSPLATSLLKDALVNNPDFNDLLVVLSIEQLDALIRSSTRLSEVLAVSPMSNLASFTADTLAESNEFQSSVASGNTAEIERLVGVAVATMTKTHAFVEKALADLPIVTQEANLEASIPGRRTGPSGTEYYFGGTKYSSHEKFKKSRIAIHGIREQSMSEDIAFNTAKLLSLAKACIVDPTTPVPDELKLFVENLLSDGLFSPSISLEGSSSAQVHVPFGIAYEVLTSGTSALPIPKGQSVRITSTTSYATLLINEVEKALTYYATVNNVSTVYRAAVSDIHSSVTDKQIKTRLWAVRLVYASGRVSLANINDLEDTVGSLPCSDISLENKLPRSSKSARAKQIEREYARVFRVYHFLATSDFDLNDIPQSYRSAVTYIRKEMAKPGYLPSELYSIINGAVIPSVPDIVRIAEIDREDMAAQLAASLPPPYVPPAVPSPSASVASSPAAQTPPKKPGPVAGDPYASAGPQDQTVLFAEKPESVTAQLTGASPVAQAPYRPIPSPIPAAPVQPAPASKLITKPKEYFAPKTDYRFIDNARRNVSLLAVSASLSDRSKALVCNVLKFAGRAEASENPSVGDLDALTRLHPGIREVIIHRIIANLISEGKLNEVDSYRSAAAKIRTFLNLTPPNEVEVVSALYDDTMTPSYQRSLFNRVLANGSSFSEQDAKDMKRHADLSPLLTVAAGDSVLLSYLTHIGLGYDVQSGPSGESYSSKKYTSQNVNGTVVSRYTPNAINASNYLSGLSGVAALRTAASNVYQARALMEMISGVPYEQYAVRVISDDTTFSTSSRRYAYTSSTSTFSVDTLISGNGRVISSNTTVADVATKIANEVISTYLFCGWAGVTLDKNSLRSLAQLIDVVLLAEQLSRKTKADNTVELDMGISISLSVRDSRSDMFFLTSGDAGFELVRYNGKGQRKTVAQASPVYVNGNGVVDHELLSVDNQLGGNCIIHVSDRNSTVKSDHYILKIGSQNVRYDI